MSSETITRNDLTNILNEVLPSGGMSRTLLWTNPSPASGFVQQEILTTTDFTQYDEIEVIGINYTTYGSIMPSLRLKIGDKGNLIGLAGSTGDASGYGYLVARGVQSYTNKVTIYEAKGVQTNTGSWATNNNNMIPLYVYGIKYAINSIVSSVDYIVEQGTDGIWTYRKWNSGIAECWGTTRFTNVPLTAQWGYGYYASNVGRSISLPSSLFTSVSSVTSGTDMHGGIGGWCYEGYSTSSVGGYLWSTASETSRVAIDVSLYVKGTWK